jgi:hypothetical protein
MYRIPCEMPMEWSARSTCLYSIAHAGGLNVPSSILGSLHKAYTLIRKSADGRRVA